MITLRKITGLIGSAVISLGIISVAQQVQAGQIYNGWNYGIDAVGDAMGGAKYDIQGIAIKESQNGFYVALTGGTPLAGVPNNDGALNGSVGWADIFLNFTGNNFKTALAQNQVYGIRFAASNDTSVPVGVYSQVQGISKTSANFGPGSLKDYYQYGPYQNGSGNTSTNMGTDLLTPQAVYTYLYGSSVANNPTYSSTPILAHIKEGTKIGNINLLNAAQLSAAGLDFGHFNASGLQTFGFQFDRSLLPTNGGDFTAHLFLECGNDGVALKGNLAAVPEPSALGTIAVFGLTMLGLKRRKIQG